MSDSLLGPPENLPSSAKETIEELKAKSWIKRHDSTTDLREKSIRFLLRAYAGLLSATVIIILLQGFKLFGFALPLSFLHWLGGATIGEIAGLLTLTLGAIFKEVPRNLD